MTGELRSYVDMEKEVPLLPGESPWTEEPGGLQSVGSQRVRQDLLSNKNAVHASYRCCECQLMC